MRYDTIVAGLRATARERMADNEQAYVELAAAVLRRYLDDLAGRIEYRGCTKQRCQIYAYNKVLRTAREDIDGEALWLRVLCTHAGVDNVAAFQARARDITKGVEYKPLPEKRPKKSTGIRGITRRGQTWLGHRMRGDVQHGMV